MSRATEAHVGDSGYVRPGPGRLDVEIRAGTLNEAARTVEVIWSKGADVIRRDWWTGERYIESLSMDPAHIRMDRFDAGMSLLDSHSAFSMDERLGVVIPGSVRIVNGVGYATVQLSRKARAEELLQDLKDGMPFPVSVGYRTLAYEKTEATEGGLARFHAIDWEPQEISAVSVPADPGAHSRAEPAATTTEDVPVRNVEPMEAGAMSRTTTVHHEDRAGADHVEGRAQRPDRPSPAEAERSRIASIQAMAQRHNLGEAFALRHVDAGTSEVDFRRIALDEIASRQDATSGTGVISGNGGARDNSRDEFVRSAGEALSAHGSTVQLSEGARQYRGLGFGDLARMALERAGERTIGMTKSEVITRALHTTSDFALTIGHAFQVAVARGYQPATDELRQTASAKSAVDFRRHNGVSLDLAARLLKINEHGEYKRGSYIESGESYKIDSFGRIVGVTRQLLVNDALGLVSQTPEMLGRKAAVFEMTQLAETLLANPSLSDGRAVFNTEDGNLLADGALTPANIAKARQHLRQTKDASGEFLNLRPRFLVVGPALEYRAEQLTTEISATKADDTNPFRNLATVVVPQIEGNAWFIACAPGDAESLVYAHLDGTPGPQIESREGWDVDGCEWRVRLDYGTAWLGRRGWYMSTGAEA